MTSSTSTGSSPCYAAWRRHRKWRPRPNSWCGPSAATGSSCTAAGNRNPMYGPMAHRSPDAPQWNAPSGPWSGTVPSSVRWPARTPDAHVDSGLPASVTDPLGHTTTLGYDAAGNPTSAVDPTGAKTTRTFDATGRLTSVVDPRATPRALTRRRSPRRMTYTTGATGYAGPPIRWATSGCGTTTTRAGW